MKYGLWVLYPEFMFVASSFMYALERQFQNLNIDKININNKIIIKFYLCSIV